MDETNDQEPEALAQLVNEFPRVFKGEQPANSLPGLLGGLRWYGSCCATSTP